MTSRPWATGINWLQAGRRIIVLPGNYGSVSAISLTGSAFSETNPAVIQAKFDAVTSRQRGRRPQTAVLLRSIGRIALSRP